jgi:drug/metabolite transporter (DMT)-like permease
VTVTADGRRKERSFARRGVSRMLRAQDARSGTMRQTMNGGDWLRLGLLSGLWGASFLFYRMLATELPPLVTTFGRVALGGAALVAILAPHAAPIALPRAQWGRFLVLAALNNAIPFTLFAWGETRVAAGTAAILNAMTPMFSVVVGALVWRSEALTRARVAGVACGIAGVAVLIGPGALLGQDWPGELACLLAALSYGFAVHYARRFEGVTPANKALGQLVAASAMLLPLVVLLDRPWALPAPSTAGWVALIGIAVPCTALAYLLFFDLIARAGANNTALVTLLVPVSALLLGAIVLGEPITFNALGGMALIAAGLAAIDGRLLRLLTRRTPEPAPPPARDAPARR